MQSVKLFNVKSAAGKRFPMVGMGDVVYMAKDICLNDINVEFGMEVKQAHNHTTKMWGIVTDTSNNNDGTFSLTISETDARGKDLLDDLNNPKEVKFTFDLSARLDKNAWTTNEKLVDELVERNTRENIAGLDRVIQRAMEQKQFIMKAAGISAVEASEPSAKGNNSQTFK